MSLQLLAKQMEAKGRKGDSMLVHMTPSEVAGLQKLAETAGGSLSVNPETGLVEANFLKRMLPTLVGIGVGAATMNPYLGAAAGAAVGGYQAKRNDQDVLLGAAMGGLGGYGGAGIGSSLASAGATGTAAQAISNPALTGPVATGAGSQASMLAAQNAGFGAQGTASLAQAAGAATPSTMAPLTQGISALGTEAGRGAFMQGVGGGAGLLSDVSMAATPLMAAGKRPGDPEVDDELYSYTYDVGRTGAENTPSGSSAERLYFDGRFSPVRKIRARDYAAKGGLMSLAEGGETAAAAEVAAPTASEAALAYLMGERSSSAPARSPFIDAQLMQGRPAPMAQAPVVGADNMYAFDPATGTFTRNQNYIDPTTGAQNAGPLVSGGSGDNNVPMAKETERFLDWEETTPEGKAHRDARMGEIQNLFNLGPTGAFMSALGGKEAKAPNFGTIFGTPPEAQTYIDNLSRISGDGSYDYSGLNSAFGSSHSDYGDTGYDRAEGGLISLAKGGMASGGFVVPADVVSALGNGSTDAGLRKLSAMMGDVKPIKGKGDGLSDSIPTNIDGKQPARVADGEAYIDPKTVKRLGGAKKLYAMMGKIRAQAHGKTTQQRPVNPGKVMA